MLTNSASSRHVPKHMVSHGFPHPGNEYCKNTQFSIGFHILVINTVEIETHWIVADWLKFQGSQAKLNILTGI